MKVVYVLNDMVTGHAWIPDGSQSATIASAYPDAAEYVVPDSSTVEAGWAVVLDADGTPTFTAPTTPTYELLTPMQFYVAFTAAERIKLKAMAETGIPATDADPEIPVDPVIAEFWATYQMSVSANAHIDPNLTSTQEALAYLAAPNAPTPPVIKQARIQQILNGIAQ